MGVFVDKILVRIYGDNEKPGCPTLPLFGIAGSLFAVIVGYIISIVSNSGGIIGYWNIISLIIGVVGLFLSCNFLLILFLSESRYSRERVRNQNNSDSPKETKTVRQIYSGERVEDQHNPDLPNETKINETYSRGGVRNKNSYLPKEINTVNEIYSREQVRNSNNSDSHKETKTVRRIYSGERLRNQHNPDLPKKSIAGRQVCSGELVRNQQNPDLPKRSKAVRQIYSQEGERNQYNSESPKETKTVSKVARNEISSRNSTFTESSSNKLYSNSNPYAGPPNSDASDTESLYGMFYRESESSQNSPESESSQNSPESESSRNSPESESSRNSPESESSRNSPESEFRPPPYGEESYEYTTHPPFSRR